MPFVFDMPADEYGNDAGVLVFDDDADEEFRGNRRW
jgi:hypothetical protein